MSEPGRSLHSLTPLRRFIHEITDGPFGSSLTSSHYSDDGARVIRLGNIGAAQFKRGDAAFISMDYFNSLRRHEVKSGDLLIAGLSDENHAVGRACVAPNNLGPSIVKADCFRARLDQSRLLHRYAAWALSSSVVSGQVLTLTRGSTRARINLEVARAIQLPVPPLDEQLRIADFLDAETARIDALMWTYARLKDLASERSQHVIDSEIEQYQKLTPFRYLVRFREGPGIMAVDFRDEGIPLIRISGLRRGEVTLNGCNFLDPDKVSRQWSQFRLKMGDRLISGSATMGGVSVVTDPAVVGSIPYTGLIILRPARQDVEMKYVEAFLRSSLFSRQIDVLKTGATMQHFGPTHLSQVQAPLPSHHEQLQIVESVQGALAHASRCGDLVKRQLALLTERRQALITAAVTGQLDVTTASGRNVTDGVSA